MVLFDNSDLPEKEVDLTVETLSESISVEGNSLLAGVFLRLR